MALRRQSGRCPMPVLVRRMPVAVTAFSERRAREIPLEDSMQLRVLDGARGHVTDDGRPGVIS